MNLRYQIRRDTAANWTSANPVLRSGELGLETDTYKLKAGDGTSAWSALGYLGGSGSGAATWGSITGTLSSQTDLQTALDAKANLAGAAFTGAITTTSTVDGRDVSVDGAKLDGIEPNATADQTAADIRALGFFDTTNDGTGSGLDADTVDGVEEAALLRADGTRSMSGSLNLGGNALTNGTVSGSLLDIGSVPLNRVTGIADNTLLGNNAGVNGPPVALTAAQVRAEINVEDGATADQTGAEIKTAYEAEADTNAFTDAEQTKLAGIETGATNTNDPLADANQTITASRTIDDGNNGYQFFVDLANGTASTAQVLVNPTTPQVTLSANNGTNTFIVQNNGAAVNFICSATSTVQLNSDPGADGECFISQGASAAPVYSGFPTVRSSTAPSNTSMLWYHTTDQELYAYDTTRSKWLSVTTYEAHFARNGTRTTNHYMRGPGGFDYNTASQIGHPMRYDVTMIAAWGSAASGGTSGWNHRIMKWDDSAGSNGVAASYAPSGTYTRWAKTDFNVDYDTNDLMGLNIFNLGSATAVTNHTAVIAYKRRAS